MQKETKLVESNNEAVKNVLYWSKKADEEPEHTVFERIAFNRCWYCCKINGEWLVAPSKFIGYQNMTLEKYITSDSLDGKQTERVLQKFRKAPSMREIREILEVIGALFKKSGRIPHLNAKYYVLPTDEVIVGDLTEAEKETVAAITQMVNALPQNINEAVIRQLSQS